MFKATHKGRVTTFSKTILTASLLGGTALSTLGAGSAQASTQLDCSFGSSTASPNCSLINWAIGWTLGDKILSNLDLTSVGTASGIFSFIEIIPSEMYSANANFNPVIPPPNAGSFSYDLSITPQGIADGYSFESVELGVNHQGTVQEVTKTITGGPTLISMNGAEIGPVPISGTSITVTDSWALGLATGSISSISNTFTQEVPAPLPLLGVGAVFGSIRKLRKFSSQLKTFSLA